MPTETYYTKSITTDFPNQKVNSTTLSREINISEIVISLSHIDTEDDNCHIWFRDVLSIQDISILDSIISNHTGEDETVPVQTVQIMEETIGTGGFFCTYSINISASPNSSATLNVF